MRSRREALSAIVRLASADALAQQLRQLDALRTPGLVAGYWAVRGEMPLHALFAPRPAFDYCLPCLADDGTMRFARWTPGADLQPNRYGIPEPAVTPETMLPAEALDVVLVPMLAFDRRGHRLGHGGGYYDRTFAFLRECERPSRPLLVGVAYAFQEIERLPHAAWDVPLDYVATDAELIRCEAQGR